VAAWHTNSVDLIGHAYNTNFGFIFACVIISLRFNLSFAHLNTIHFNTHILVKVIFYVELLHLEGRKHTIILDIGFIFACVIISLRFNLSSIWCLIVFTWRKDNLRLSLALRINQTRASQLIIFACVILSFSFL